MKSFTSKSFAVHFTFALLNLIMLISESTGVKKVHYSENDSRKVPIVHVEGVLGHRAELPCDITPRKRDDTVYMVLWFRENVGKPFYSFDVRGRGVKTAKTSSMKNGFDRRADFQAGSYPAHLLVSDLQLGDEGIYRCRVDYRYSPTRNSLVNLTVVVPPSMPVIYDETGQEISSVLGPYLEGSDVRLNCRVHGGKPEPSLVWNVNGELEDATYHSDRYGNVINELVFRGLNRSHLNSQFSCKASNTRLIQPVEKSVVLDLNLKPLYVKVKQKQADRLVAGREYRFVCETAGSKPPALLKWIKGGKEITQVTTQDMDAGNVTQSTFLFVPMPEDNGGRIACRAENPWLNRSSIPYHVLEESWTINVVYAPKVTLKLGANMVAHIKEGDDIYFDCSVSANPPYTRLSWYHNEEELKHTPNAGIIMSNQSLVLQGITRRSEGNYSCAATNAEGSTPSNPMHLSVQHTPICRSTMGVTVGAAKGEDIALRCAVDASPPVLRFEWEFHGTGDSVDVVPVGREVMSQEDLSKFLYTPKMDADFGTFLCWGSNELGRQVQPCVFHVVPAVKPNPLENCTLINQTTTMIHIECNAHRELPQIPDQPLFRIMHGDGDVPNASQDSAQYGLFPEYYVMEVWDLKDRTIRKNLSAETPVFILKGLTPGSVLRLVLYAANSHGKSDPHVIEAVVAGDAERHMLGASTSRMDFFPVAAVVLGLGIIGTVLLLFVVMLFRTRLRSGSSRTSQNGGRTQPNNNGNSHSHPLEKPNSLMLTSGLTSTTGAGNNSSSATSNNSAGYRALPQSKAEADSLNPDIILGANGNSKNFSTDYQDELGRTLSSRKGVFIPGNVPVPGGGESSPIQQHYVNSTLPRPCRTQAQAGLLVGNGGTGNANGTFHQHPHHHQHNQLQEYQTLHHPKSNYVKDYPSPHYHHGPLPPNDYNTIYIRDKLLHDSDIPESCV